MGQLVLLVVAAAWAAVLIPPLLRSRIENRPNSSVSDFRNQLSSLQRAMPSRGVAMRSMARPLAPSPLSRPAATGRPPLRSGRAAPTAGPRPATATARRPSPVSTRTDGARLYDATPRARSHGDRPAAAGRGVRRPVRRRPARAAAEAPPGQRAVRAGPRVRRARCSSPPPPRRRRGCTCSGRRSSPSPATSGCSASCASASRRRRRCWSRRRDAPARPAEPAAPGRPGPWPARRRTRRRSAASPGPPAGRRPLVSGRLIAPAADPRRADPLPSSTRPTRRYTRGVLGAVAQLVERNNRTVEARGSIPLSSTGTDAPAVRRGHRRDPAARRRSPAARRSGRP